MSKIGKNTQRHMHLIELKEIEERPIYNASLFDQLIAESDFDSQQEGSSFPLPGPFEDEKHETTTNQADITPLIDEDFFVIEPQCLEETMMADGAEQFKKNTHESKSAKALPRPKKTRNFCICRRMKCDKRYCSCFKNGNSCGANCQCTNCNNLPKTKKITKIAQFTLQPFWRFEWNAQQQL